MKKARRASLRPDLSGLIGSLNLICVSINSNFFILRVDSSIFSYSRSGGRYAFVCTALDGSACADYGLEIRELETGSGSDPTVKKVDNVCHVGAVHGGRLGDVELRLWYASRSLFRLDCFLWATDNGQLPTTSAGTVSELKVIIAAAKLRIRKLAYRV